MKTSSIHSLMAAALLAGGLSLSNASYSHAADPASMDPRDATSDVQLSDTTMPTTRVEVADLEKILTGLTLGEGWNKIVTLSDRQDQIWAEVSNGKITAWQVKTVEGKDLRTHVRDAENPNNLRITWEPESGPGRFLEAPATVIRP